MEANKEESQEVPTFYSFFDLFDMSLKFAAFRTGLELDIWGKIADGQSTAVAIAGIEGWDVDGTRRLADMLVSLGLLAYEANQYALVPESSWYLVPGKPTYMGNFLLHLMGWDGDCQLAGAIRHGKRPMTKDLMDEDLDPIWPEFFAYQRAAPEQDLKEFEAMWKSLGIQARDGLKVLDFACGSAIKTLALCRLNPGVTAMLQDRPHVLEIAFEIATKLGVADQIEKLPGDMRSVDFGGSQFDVIRVGNTLRYLGPAEIGAVLGRVRRAMNPGGVFIIEDFIAEDVVTQGAYAPLDALWLYAITPNGDTYTFSNWQTFLEKAGFSTITRNESLIKAIVA